MTPNSTLKALESAEVGSRESVLRLSLEGNYIELARMTTTLGERGRIDAKGAFRNAKADAMIREIFFSQDTMPWRIETPGEATIDGSYLIGALEYTGETEGEAVFALTLTPALHPQGDS